MDYRCGKLKKVFMRLHGSYVTQFYFAIRQSDVNEDF